MPTARYLVALALLLGALAIGADEAKPNLVKNGDFETIDAKTGLPVGWHAYPRNSSRIQLVDGGKERPGKVVKLSGTGAFVIHIDRIFLKPNMRYRVTGYTRSNGPITMIFVKGYGKVVRGAKTDNPVEQYETVYQMKKRLQIDETVAGHTRQANTWERFNLDFEVKPALVFSDFQHKIEFFRVKLYTSFGSGACWFDDIRFEEAGPVPEAERLHPEMVTHAGLAPNLGPAASEPPPDYDEEQHWVDAQNAWKDAAYADCLKLSRALIAASPAKGMYRLLAARAAIELREYESADELARWVLGRTAMARPGGDVEPWQIEWARLVRAQAKLNSADPAEGKAMLAKLAKSATDRNVKLLAQRLLAAME